MDVLCSGRPQGAFVASVRRICSQCRILGTCIQGIRNDIESFTSFDFGRHAGPLLGCHAGPLLLLRHGCKGPAWHPEFLATVIWVKRVIASLAEVGSEKCQ